MNRQKVLTPGSQGVLTSKTWSRGPRRMQHSVTQTWRSSCQWWLPSNDCRGGSIRHESYGGGVVVEPPANQLEVDMVPISDQFHDDPPRVSCFHNRHQGTGIAMMKPAHGVMQVTDHDRLPGKLMNVW